MIILNTAADFNLLIASPVGPDLRRLLDLRRDEIGETRFIVAQPGDTAEEVETALGFPIITNFLDETSIGDPDFTPNHEWSEQHPGGWTELAFIFGDGAEVLLVPDLPGIDTRLRLLCRDHA